MVDKVKQGKKNRASGAAFELRVRKDLEDKGYIVDKWSNNVEFNYLNMGEITEDSSPTHGKIIPAKRKYSGPGRPLAIGTGFPDFLAFTFKELRVNLNKPAYKMNIKEDKTIIEFGLNEELVNGKIATVIGVECKTNNYLDKVEKAKCQWYLDNQIFSKILIASKIKVKNKVVINYKEFNGK